MDRDREQLENVSQSSQIYYLATQVERLADLVDEALKRIAALETDRATKAAVAADRQERQKFPERVRLLYYAGVIGIGAWVLEHMIQSLAEMAKRTR